MEKERVIELAYLVKNAAALGLLVFAVFGALTKGQREYIREERDGGECWFPECRAGHPVCGARSVKEATCKKQVHHILPARYLKTFGIDPDNEETILLSVGTPAHQRKIHPDMEEARKEYGVNKNSYHDKFEAREEKIKKHQPYWVTVWDRAMLVYALLNTQKAHSRGLQMPRKEIS